MRSPSAAGIVAVALATTLAAPLAAQAWGDARALELVRRATDRRAGQLADSGLVDYRATAHGYLTFLAQLGEGFLESPRVVKADELALQVYWHAPNLSKQRIVGRRDTTLFPTDIQYHRDHLGIVQNDFPAVIRLGEGDEVRDVPHPLSAAGLQAYQFALGDSLRITIPGRVIDVYELRVRPADDRAPAVVGAVYLDRETAQVVRMAFSFTRASFLDPQLEDVSIVLENGLVATRYWLPRRQDIEIRRTMTWMRFPVRGIIRGRWEIGEYDVNVDLASAQFAGPEIVPAPAAELQRHAWNTARIVDSLPPESRLATPTEVRRVQAEARALVRAQALQRARGLLPLADGASEIVRFNRAEGLTLGAGVALRLRGAWSLEGRSRWGLDDRRGKGRVQLATEGGSGRSAAFFVERTHRDLGDVAERSSLINSLAAQEFASDYTDPYAVMAWGLSIGWRRPGTSWRLELAEERPRSLAVAARPFAGRFSPTLLVDSNRARSARLVFDHAGGPAAGVQVRAHGEARLTRVLATAGCACAGIKLRGAVDVELARAVGAVQVVTRTLAAGSPSGGLRPQDHVFLGGPVSGPGYPYHSLVGGAAVSQRLELQVPAPFARVSLGRFGRSPARATLAPFVMLLALGAPTPVLYTPSVGTARDPLPRGSGVYPAVGVAVQPFFDAVRLETARGANGGGWTFSVDVNRAFWGIL